MTNKILSNNQIAVLDKIKKSDFLIDNFYLTGGTALAAFYLYHRYSEDLDFFSEKEFDLMPINVFFNQIKKELGIVSVDFQQSYNRNLFFLHFKEEREALKMEFTFFPFPRIEPGQKNEGVPMDGILDIAVNKLFTIYQRTQARDYIDLYCIVQDQKFSIDDLIGKAKIKFDWHIDPIQLGAQFIKSQEAKDYPRMIREISDQEWQGFFMEEAKKLKGKILTSY